MPPLHFIDSCESTNDCILTYLNEYPKTCAVCTFNQTQGRGQYGNTWNSPTGKNIAYSLAYPVSRSPHSHLLFNYHTATILKSFIDILTDENTKIKWPNDLILKGKKISGMLIEKTMISGKAFYILGIGLNVLQDDFRTLPKAGSLVTQTHKPYDIQRVASLMHKHIYKQITRYKSEQDILTIFNEHLFRKDEVSVFQKNNIRQNGIVRYADAEGYLWIDLENEGLQRFFHKEIEMLY